MKDDFVYEEPLQDADVEEMHKLADQNRKLAKETVKTTESVVDNSEVLYKMAAGSREMSDATNYFTIGMSTLTGHAASGNKALMYFSAVAGSTAAVLSAYKALKALTVRKTATETSLAVAETSAYAVGQQWGNIALAVGAAASVGISFGVGYSLGKSKKVDLNASIDTPIARRDAVRKVQGVSS
jgi:coenzyme F420-reducing hydrogenase alpha subunit